MFACLLACLFVCLPRDPHPHTNKLRIFFLKKSGPISWGMVMGWCVSLPLWVIQFFHLAPCLSVQRLLSLLVKRGGGEGGVMSSAYFAHFLRGLAFFGRMRIYCIFVCAFSAFPSNPGSLKAIKNIVPRVLIMIRNL